jgi:hypothetical protein
MTDSSWARLIRGDEPSAQSNNGRFFAEPGAAGRGPKGSTEVFRVLGPKKSEKIWEKPGWFPETFLSDDGEYLVSGDNCSGVLPRPHTMDAEIASFFRRGTPVRVVRLRDVILDPKRLRGSMWGLCRGFLGDGHRFAIDTWEFRRLVFDVATGKLLETLPIKDIPNVD